ncbi:MAG TPA: glycosyltransferase family 9 protein [Candidatus Cybelea sp.]|nr:glycosyltransferase family 9 protein [Candidatus Cybelea sp.]
MEPRSVGVGAPSILVHLATGLGNIVLATSLLVTLSRRFRTIDLRLDADYPGAGDLFRDWSALRAVYDTGAIANGAYEIIVPAIPPFAWPRFSARYRNHAGLMPRPDDALFYADEQAYYLDFARRLGCAVPQAPQSFVPAFPSPDAGISSATLVLAPGCKTGIMAAKRWPHYPELAALFDDVAIVGTPDDLRLFDGTPIRFPAHARSLVGSLQLRGLAGVLAASGVVVANDSGIAHLSAALGVPTILLFGPTPDQTLGRLPPNATVMRAGLPCEPCWLSRPLDACQGRIDCLHSISVESVAAKVQRALARKHAASNGHGTLHSPESDAR